MKAWWQRVWLGSDEQDRALSFNNQQPEPKGVVYRAGKVESAWRLNPRNYAIVDITNTGETARANGITPVASIMQAALMFIRKPDEELTRSALQNLSDLLEMLLEAAEERPSQDKEG